MISCPTFLLSCYFFIVPLADTTPPVIRFCPVSILTLNVPPGVIYRTATWTEPTATDNSGVTPTVMQSHHPGDTFLVGTTEVTYRFSDMAGNSALCRFTVAVGRLREIEFETCFFVNIIKLSKT